MEILAIYAFLITSFCRWQTFRRIQNDDKDRQEHFQVNNINLLPFCTVCHTKNYSYALHSVVYVELVFVIFMKIVGKNRMR
jgi:5-methylcytosine-specific restriction endonuclease McrA